MKRCACALLSCRHTCGGKMVKFVQHGVDKGQIKKAVKALFAYQKTKEKAKSLLLNEHDQILLLLTVWKIPNQEKVIRISLPHGIRPDTTEVCLFTRDEPNMSSDQTESFYKKLLSHHGVKQITEIIPLKKMKKEYKQFEAKRRLLSSFDLFLADARIRRLLPSHIGKHFYKEKREPASVNLKHKNLAAVLNHHIQGTRLHVNTKGSCSAVRVGHMGMKVKDIVENTLAVARVLAKNLPENWKNVKVLHLKTQSSVALPIYTSSFDSLTGLNLIKAEKEKSAEESKQTSGSEETGDQIAKEKTDKKKSAKKSKPATSGSEETGEQKVKGKKDTKKSAKRSKPATSGSEETGEQILEEKKDTEKSAKKSKPATSGSEEIKDQISEENKDTEKSAKKSKPATSGSEEIQVQISEEKKDTEKSAKKSKPATSGSEETGEQISEENKDTEKSAKKSKPATSGSEEIQVQILEENKDTEKSAKNSKPATSGSEETGEQISEENKDTEKSAKNSKPATSGSEEIQDQISEENKDTEKSAKNSKPATSGSEETGDHTAEKKDTATPRKGQNQPNEEEEEIPQLIPIQEPSSAKRKNKKEIVVQEESEVEEKIEGSEENVEVPSSRKSTLRKRKMNESEEVVKTPNKHKKDLASEEKIEQPEKQESPPKRGISKRTPKKTPSTSAAKLTKSARKAPQTPKLRQKKKMKSPQSV